MQPSHIARAVELGVLSSLSDSLSNKSRHQDVQDRFELLKLLDLFIALPELESTSFLLPVYKHTPAYSVEHP